jgi:FAD/FMN-containing dehydrogenase
MRPGRRTRVPGTVALADHPRDVVIKVDVRDVQRRDLRAARPGVQEQPDEREIPSVLERSSVARCQECPELVLGEHVHALFVHGWGPHLPERADLDLLLHLSVTLSSLVRGRSSVRSRPPAPDPTSADTTRAGAQRPGPSRFVPHWWRLSSLLLISTARVPLVPRAGLSLGGVPAIGTGSGIDRDIPEPVDTPVLYQFPTQAACRVVPNGMPFGRDSGPDLPFGCVTDPFTTREPRRCWHGDMSDVAMQAWPAAWELLRGSLRGDLVTPSDARYDRARVGYWAQFDGVMPSAVAFCATPADVAGCLAFCQDNGIPAVPRSGGHSLGGYSTSEGLVIDVSRMSQAHTIRTPGAGDGITAIVGPGARQVDSLTALWRDGVALPGGLCPTVSAGGFVTGGGFGWMTRRYGMACDHVVAAEVVLADGRVVRCSESVEPDLFWAVRGAGGGNFGVITEFEMLPRRIQTIVSYHLRWPLDAADAVIAAWQRWILEAPDELGSALSVILPDGGPATVDLAGGWLADRAELERHLDALVAAVSRPPMIRTMETDSYFDAMMKVFGVADTTAAQRQWTGQNPDAVIPRQHFAVDRSVLLERAIPDTGIGEVLAALERDPRPGQVRLLSFFALGGQANRVGRTASAYVHRDAQFYLAFWVGLERDLPGDDPRRAAEAWADEGFAVIDRYSGGEAYQNFIDPRLDNWRQAYYAENYARLAEVKRIYDPHGFFRFAQSIG